LDKALAVWGNLDGMRVAEESKSTFVRLFKILAHQSIKANVCTFKISAFAKKGLASRPHRPGRALFVQWQAFTEMGVAALAK